MSPTPALSSQTTLTPTPAAQPEANGISPEQAKILNELESFSRIFDSMFRLPLAGGLGVDGLVGLVLPGAGDLLTILTSGYLISRAHALGVPNEKIAAMVRNAVVDAMVGAVPVAGDLFDFAFKANVKNLNLIREHFGMRPVNLKAPQASEQQLRAESQQAAARNQLTPESFARTGEGIFGLKLKGGGQRRYLALCGQVSDAQRSAYSSTTVSGTAYAGYGTVSSSTRHHTRDDFWLLTPSGREVSLWLRNINFPIRNGQKVTAVFEDTRGEPLLALYNHTTGSRYVFVNRIRVLTFGFARLFWSTLLGLGIGAVALVQESSGRLSFSEKAFEEATGVWLVSGLAIYALLTFFAWIGNRKRFSRQLQEIFQTAGG